MQKECSKTAYYKGPLDCIRKIIAEEGIPHGFFRGLASTLARETPCYAGQFAAYYSTKQFLVRFNNLKSTDDLGMMSQLIAGGVGGFFAWFVSYPQDVIKTKLQVGQIPLTFKKYHPMVPDGGMINCAIYIYRNEGGWLGFWRGFSACIPRAIIANSFMFVTYDYC